MLVTLQAFQGGQGHHAGILLRSNVVHRHLGQPHQTWQPHLKSSVKGKKKYRESTAKGAQIISSYVENLVRLGLSKYAEECHNKHLNILYHLAKLTRASSRLALEQQQLV